MQNGVDDCGHYYVDPEKLEELLQLIKRVLEDHSLADELLPSQSGFFFGNTTYDEWYFEELESTKNGLENILSIFKEEETLRWDFEYHSSW